MVPHGPTGRPPDAAVQYEGPGVDLAFPHVDQSDPLLLLQLQHRFTAVCSALKHSLRCTTDDCVLFDYGMGEVGCCGFDSRRLLRPLLAVDYCVLYN